MTPHEIEALTIGAIVRGPTLRESDPIRNYKVVCISEDRTIAAGMSMAARTPKTQAWRYAFALDQMNLIQQES